MVDSPNQPDHERGRASLTFDWFILLIKLIKLIK